MLSMSKIDEVKSRSMVGTRHAVSDNNSKSGLGMPSPYNPEREQIQDRKAGLKRDTVRTYPLRSVAPRHP